MKPVLLVIAGPNGAGKTTVTARLRAERWSEGVEYLNPDEIARDRFGDWNSPEAIRKAADWTKLRREELLARGAGIAFETVLSTDEKIDFLARAKTAGYFIRVFFIATEGAAGRLRHPAWAMASILVQASLRHSSRNLPLKLSQRRSRRASRV